MHGNVREWCADFFGPYDGAAATDPRGPATGRERVIRGDGYLFLGHGAGSARRCLDLPGVTYCDLGFRPAKTVPAE
jgi:formylglycine-generating enzyme required for sulfatase activity